jgi:hypothetical protein
MPTESIELWVETPASSAWVPFLQKCRFTGKRVLSPDNAIARGLGGHQRGQGRLHRPSGEWRAGRGSRRRRDPRADQDRPRPRRRRDPAARGGPGRALRSTATGERRGARLRLQPRDAGAPRRLVQPRLQSRSRRGRRRVFNALHRTPHVHQPADSRRRLAGPGRGRRRAYDGETIWRHYAREFDRARTTEVVPMEAAIRAARRRIARSRGPKVDRGSNDVPLRAINDACLAC